MQTPSPGAFLRPCVHRHPSALPTIVRPIVIIVFLIGCRHVTPRTPSPPNPATQPTLPGNRAVSASATQGGPLGEFVLPAFKDVTLQAGIRFQHQSSKTSQKYMIETMGSGCAFIDYDGDGWLDVLLVNDRLLPGGHVDGRPTLALYHNDRNGHFTDRTHEMGLDRDSMYGMGVAVGDYDNDGWQDFYVSSVLGPGHLYHNEHGRRFVDVTAQAGVGNAGKWGTSCAWIDYDRDGKLDLFIADYVRYRSLSDDQPCFEGDNRNRVYCFPVAYESSSCVLYHNAGNGKFRDVSVESGIAVAHGKSLGVAVWDYDGDGWPDIFVANDTTASFLFHNEKNGRFTEVGAETGIAYDDSGNAHSGMGIDAADALNDGRTSLVITNYFGQQTCYYTQAATASFRDDRQPSGVGPLTLKSLGFGICFLDYDNDGWQDLLQVNGHVQDDIQKREPQTPYAEPTLMLRNGGRGDFSEVGLKTGAPFNEPLVARGLAWGDYDNDGRLDALISCNNGAARLWRNETLVKRHWLTLKLVGTKSNRDGIGAVVIAKSNGLQQTRMVRSACSYLSSSDLRPHFGLGNSTAADVEIRWPSGTIDHLKNLPADRIWTIKEATEKAE